MTALTIVGLAIGAAVSSLMIFGLWKIWKAVRDTRALILFILRQNDKVKQEIEQQVVAVQGSKQKSVMRFDGFNHVAADNMRREHVRVARIEGNAPPVEKEAFAILSDELGRLINEEVKKNL